MAPHSSASMCPNDSHRSCSGVVRCSGPAADAVPKAPTREEARVPDEELDGAAQLAVGQGPDQDVVAGQPVGERGVAGALTEMIGANGGHHRSVPLGGEVEQAADELFPLATVDAGGKRLLELVDEHDPGPIRRPV